MQYCKLFFYLTLASDNYISIIILYTIYSMNKRRIFKANTNYQNQQYSHDCILKKQPSNEQTWKLLADSSASSNLFNPNFSLFFDNPHTFLNCRRLQRHGQMQRLKQGLCILLHGKIRVLLCKEMKNTSKFEIEHALNKMKSKPLCKYNKLSVIQVTQPYQIIYCSNNCLALPGSQFWYISPEELTELHFFEKLREISGLMALNDHIFRLNTQLVFAYRQIILPFRSKVQLPRDIEVAVIKKGSILIQWAKHQQQKVLVGEGNVIIKNEDYYYTCESSQVELIGVVNNSTFQYYSPPPWTNTPQPKQAIIARQQDQNQALLFRSRSLNLQRLTAHQNYRQKPKYTKIDSSLCPNKNRLSLSVTPTTTKWKDANKQRWALMRKIQSFQIASNTRAAIQYKRIDQIRRRFKKERKNNDFPFQNELILSKKSMRDRGMFVKGTTKIQGRHGSPHLIKSISTFFENHAPDE